MSGTVTMEIPARLAAEVRALIERKANQVLLSHREADILHLYRSGVRTTRIAALMQQKYGRPCSRGYIYNITAKHGLVRSAIEAAAMASLQRAGGARG